MSDTNPEVSVIPMMSEAAGAGRHAPGIPPRRGRALLAQPKLLLLDEPTEGLALVIVRQMHEWIALIKAQRIPILLAEQNALFALHLADRGYILEKGRIRHEAPAAELSGSAEVRRYLGVQENGPHRYAQDPASADRDDERDPLRLPAPGT